MITIGKGSFAPQRRKENKIVSDLADMGLLLDGHVTTDTIAAFALTRNLSPHILLLMYQQAGLIDPEIELAECDHFPAIYRARL